VSDFSEGSNPFGEPVSTVGPSLSEIAEIRKLDVYPITDGEQTSIQRTSSGNLTVEPGVGPNRRQLPIVAFGRAAESARVHVVLPLFLANSAVGLDGIGFTVRLFGAVKLRYLAVQVRSTKVTDLDWSIDLNNPPVDRVFSEVHLFRDLSYRLKDQKGQPWQGFDHVRFVLSAEAPPGEMVGLELSEFVLVDQKTDGSPTNLLQEPSDLLDAVGKISAFFQVGSFRESAKRAERSLEGGDSVFFSETDAGRSAKSLFSKENLQSLSRSDKAKLFGLLPVSDLAIHWFLNQESTERISNLIKVIWQAWMEHWSGLDNSTRDTMLWYDHSIAERLMALNLLYLFSSLSKDSDTFEESLESQIESHSWLLFGEAAYARNQPDRWHNHALFQDIALLMTSEILSSSSLSKALRRKAFDRIELYVENAVVYEDGFAGTVEGATGYLVGIAKLLRAILSMGQGEIRASGLIKAVEGMERLIDILTYPDGRLPAIGDTHFSMPRGPVKTRKNLLKGVWHLPKIGYTVIRGEALSEDSVLIINSGCNSMIHRHEDLLSFVLFAHGVEWVTDGGYSSQDSEDELGAYLRSHKAHSISSLENTKYSMSSARVEAEVQRRNGQTEFTGRHWAWAKHRFQRRITVEGGPGALLISDDFEPLPRETKSVFFDIPFGPQVSPRFSRRNRCVTLEHSDFSGRLCLEWISPDHIFRANSPEVFLQSASVSPSPHKREPVSILRLEQPSPPFALRIRSFHGSD
jgi:hypothetical protein